MGETRQTDGMLEALPDLTDSFLKSEASHTGSVNPIKQRVIHQAPESIPKPTTPLLQSKLKLDADYTYLENNVSILSDRVKNLSRQLQGVSNEVEETCIRLAAVEADNTLRQKQMDKLPTVGGDALTVVSSALMTVEKKMDTLTRTTNTLGKQVQNVGDRVTQQEKQTNLCNFITVGSFIFAILAVIFAFFK